MTVIIELSLVFGKLMETILFLITLAIDNIEINQYFHRVYYN